MSSAHSVHCHIVANKHTYMYNVVYMVVFQSIKHTLNNVDIVLVRVETSWGWTDSLYRNFSQKPWFMSAYVLFRVWKWQSPPGTTRRNLKGGRALAPLAFHNFIYMLFHVSTNPSRLFRRVNIAQGNRREKNCPFLAKFLFRESTELLEICPGGFNLQNRFLSITWFPLLYALKVHASIGNPNL